MAIEKRTLKKSFIEERCRIQLQTDVIFIAGRQSSSSRDAQTSCFHIFLHSSTVPRGPRPPKIRGFTITLRHTTVGRTPLDE